jgi:hypothetical protein
MKDENDKRGINSPTPLLALGNVMITDSGIAAFRADTFL